MSAHLGVPPFRMASFDLKLEPRLSQQLTITPQLKQAIKLLQLNHQDLVEQLQDELLENPILQETSDDTPDIEYLDRLRRQSQGAEEAQRDTLDQQNGALLADANLAGLDEPGRRRDESGQPLSDEVWARILEEAGTYNPRGSSGGGLVSDDLPPIETNLTTTPSLFEHLQTQLRMQSCTDAEARAAYVILHNLDSKGYLVMTLDEVAEEAGVDLDDAEGGQMVVQSLDPVGCGSSGLVDCLVYQAGVLFPDDPFFPDLLRGHLNDLETRNYTRIAAAMDMDVEDVIEYHRMLREEGFNPRPGSGYNDADPQFVTPDVEVFRVGEQWQIRLNEDGLPKLRISPYYKRVLETGTPEEKRYVRQKLESADFLLRSIYQRQSTIQKVMEAILERQRGFFEHGVTHLKPMVLKDVADQIERHESTVSRVTANKYVQCPQGLLELKYFFDSGVKGAGGQEVASTAVKHLIKQLIDGESRASPLSDQDLAERLDKKGVRCARRTVAKYREELGILPSSRRKALF